MPTHDKLELDVRLYHRDELRAARYSALADAEGFGAICFAIEALGVCLSEEKLHMGGYRARLEQLASLSTTLTELAARFPATFTGFGALYRTVNDARNDAMHSGVYARHATAAAIELCIGFEEAIMKTNEPSSKFVRDLMVKMPVSVEKWQPVARARQMMLMYSFSFLPVFDGDWKLLSEVALAKYLRVGKFSTRMGKSIMDASHDGLELIPASIILPDASIDDLLSNVDVTTTRTLWLVRDKESPKDHLEGVLSPFETM